MERQQILVGEGSTEIAMILEEHVVYRPMGSTEIQREQLGRLLELMAAEHIKVRVLPTSHAPHAGHSGAFVLYEMPEPYRNVVHVETPVGSLYVEEPAVQRLQEVWQDLEQAALSEADSGALIKSVLEEMAG